jgi:hypothetical protein
MEKSAQPGEGGGWGVQPTPFHYIYHHLQSCGVHAPAERADTLPLFLLYPYMYSVTTTLLVMVTLSPPCPSKIFRQGNKNTLPLLWYIQCYK